jgi:hypothetical protein
LRKEAEDPEVDEHLASKHRIHFRKLKLKRREENKKSKRKKERSTLSIGITSKGS